MSLRVFLSWTRSLSSSAPSFKMPQTRNTRLSGWPPKREPQFTDEASRARYHKEVLGLRGPIDLWVARVTEKFNRIQARAKRPTFLLAWGDVRCDFTMVWTSVCQEFISILPL